ncbi:MAG TPA: pirin family protein [Arenimonas sp.]|nr:pirin family protein [Arenimonas sp.]
MSTTLRPVLRTVTGMPTSDGAGVRLTRLLGTPQLPDLDPFLMLDEFGSDRPGDYIAGFPAHPHRGFETVTYMLDGRMRHKDNQGNEGLLTPGAVQWMTAGRGIVHSEMPEQEQGLMRGFQLWVNLPAKDKLCTPQYQEFSAERIPVVGLDNHGTAKLIAGRIGDVEGPVRQPATDPTYIDLQLPAGAVFEHALPSGHNAFAYVYEGSAAVGASDATEVARHQLAVLGTGDIVRIVAGDAGARVILVAGRPLREPVARYGPFVMNTRAELEQAFADYQAGRF